MAYESGLSESILRSRAQTGEDLRRLRLDPNYWFPVARSRDVRAGKAVGRSFAGEPIVIARTQSEKVFALEDRCAHRQVPLHRGVVNGERLQCGYHCWTYDATGRCVDIPYLNKEKAPNIAVRSYPCREDYGFVWIFPGDSARAEAAAFPDIASWRRPVYRTRYLDRQVRCHFSFMHENLMDMNHQFLHRRLMGGIRPSLLDLRRGENFVEADYTFSRVSGRQSLGEKAMLASGPKSGGRGHDLMTIRTEYPYQTLRYWTRGGSEPALDLWNVYAPVDADQKINHTFGLMMIRKPKAAFLLHLFWPAIVWFTEGIFAEDRDIVEAEQRAHDAQGADWNREVSPVIIALKKLLAAYSVPPPSHASLDGSERENPAKRDSRARRSRETELLAGRNMKCG